MARERCTTTGLGRASLVSGGVREKGTAHMSVAIVVLLGLVAWALLSLLAAVVVGGMTKGRDAASSSSGDSSAFATSGDGPVAA
jgi:hypothetical protein